MNTVNILENVEKNITKPFRETFFRLEIGYEGRTAFVVPVINGKRIPPVRLSKDVKIIFEGHADNPSLSIKDDSSHFGWIDFVRAMGG